MTDDPAQTIVGGGSYGGLAATFAAFQHPELFGNVLSMSGSYWWTPPDESEHEWLTRQNVLLYIRENRTRISRMKRTFADILEIYPRKSVESALTRSHHEEMRDSYWCRKRHREVSS